MQEDDSSLRWAQDDDNIVWCNSPEGVLGAAEDGKTAIEVGGVDEPLPILQAIERIAPTLKSLSLTGCNLDATMLAKLGTCLSSTQLWGIGISNNPGIDGAVWAEFWNKLPATTAKFDFGDNNLPDDALPQLMDRLSRGRVVELFLDGNNLTNVSPLFPLVAERRKRRRMKSCPETSGLTELDLGDNSLQDVAILALAQVLPGSALTTLVLGRNAISDVGGSAIARVLPQTKIHTLHLDSTQIGDATLDALVSVLPSCQELVELHVDETKVTDAGVLRFCQALPQSRIQLFDAGENNLSDEAIEAVEAAVSLMTEDVVME